MNFFVFFNECISVISKFDRTKRQEASNVRISIAYMNLCGFVQSLLCLSLFERRNFESDIPGQISSYILSIVSLFLARQPIFKRAKSISLHLIQTNSKNWLFLHLLERILNESSWHYLNEFKLLLPTVIYEYAYWLKPAISMLHAFKWVHMNTFNVYSLYLYLLVA